MWVVSIETLRSTGLYPRLQVQPRPKLVDFYDAENRQWPCRMIIRHEKDPLSGRLTWRLSAKLKFLSVAETSRNITTRVIERDVKREIHYFLEESRGFRARQHGHRFRQNGRQSRQGRQLGSSTKISPSSH
ncbi:hypothetical protein TNCV_2909201 [Trichonephila clavipes]|nr:hypothetical protein TNCV_2909201 [Trichonephila clavipes]